MNGAGDRLRTLFEVPGTSSRSDGVPRWFTDAETPVPVLHKVVERHGNGEIDGIDEIRAASIEKLRSVDSVAFWLQAVGDGTPVPHTRHDDIERVTPFSVGYLTGYGNVTHPEIRDITPHLFAHHLGMQTNPTLGDQRKTPTQMLEDELEFLYDHTEHQYHGPRFAEDALQLPRPTDYREEIERAVSVLEGDLTMFWLQILCDEQPVMLSITGGVDEGDLNYLPRPIEWGLGAAADLQEEATGHIALYLLAQHLFVGARTAGMDLETFGEQVLQLDPTQHHAENGSI